MSFSQYRSPPYTTAVLVQQGDALLQECQSPDFVKALSRGRYTASQFNTLHKIFNYIQSVNLPSNSSTGAPAGSNTDSTAVQQVPYDLPPVDAHIASSGYQHFLLVPPGGPPSFAGAQAAAQSSHIARVGSLETSSGIDTLQSVSISRNFGGYASATPIDVCGDGGKYLLNVTMAMKELGVRLRVWVCAVPEEQQQQHTEHQLPAAVEAAQRISSNDQQFQSMLPHEQQHQDKYPEDDIGSLLIPISTLLGTAEVDGLPWTGLHVAQPLLSVPDELNFVSSKPVDMQAAASNAAAAAANPPAPAQDLQATAAASTTAAPFNSTHLSKAVEAIRLRKRTADSGQAVTLKLLVDKSVGWCVVEPYSPTQSRKSDGSQAAADSSGAVKRTRINAAIGPSPVAPAAAATQALGSLSTSASSSLGPSESSGLLGVSAAASLSGQPSLAGSAASAGSAPVLSGLQQLHLGDHGAASQQPMTAPAAAAVLPQGTVHAEQTAAPPQRQPHFQALTGLAAVPDETAVLSLTQRVQRMTLRAPLWPDHKVLSLFHPVTAPASGVQVPDPGSESGQQLLQVLMERDVRDKFERNVLHLAVTQRKEENTEGQRHLLNFLMSDPALINKLQVQVNNNGATPLLLAATWGQLQVYGRLLKAATMDVLETSTKSGWSVLHRLADSAATAKSPADRKKLQESINLTIDRLFEVAEQAAKQEAAELQQQQVGNMDLQQQHVQVAAKKWVVGMVTDSEPSSHYQGRAVMNDIGLAVQQKLQTWLPALCL